LLLGARISRQREQRGHNRRSYKCVEVFFHSSLQSWISVKPACCRLFCTCC
jgi:hypothetical protein